MGKNTGIPWADNTWNPWQGCHKVSAGCDNCYMERDKKRYGHDPHTVIRSSPATFNLPNKWKEPATVFVCSWSDFFIEEADPWRDEAWDIMAKNRHLTFLLLTKRPENIAERLPKGWSNFRKNVWIGTTAENQEMANKRVPILTGIHHDQLFLSIEPMLGPVDLYMARAYDVVNWRVQRHIDWVIVGGESGNKARHMEYIWAKKVELECFAAEIPFFFKQMSGKTRKERENIPDTLNIRQFPF